MSTICHIVDYGATTAGSFIPALQRLAHAINSRGEKFALIAAEVPGSVWPAQLMRDGIDVRLVRSPKEAVRQIRALHADVVHSHFTRFDAAACLNASGARVFWHLHSHREDYSAAARLKAFAKYRILGSRVEAMVTVSHAMHEECLQWFAPAQRLRVVYNGIDCDWFRPPGPQERTDSRAALGIGGDEHVVLFFDRAAYKGGAVVRQAFTYLAGARLLIAGTPPNGGGQPRNVMTIERAADARQLYWAADALAFASNREAFGLVLVEAMACGLPVAATDIPIVHELCEGVPSVFFFGVGDAQGLAAAIERTKERADTNAARAHVVERFSLDRWTRDMLALYER